jgi:hypothetical protein
MNPSLILISILPKNAEVVVDDLDLAPIGIGNKKPLVIGVCCVGPRSRTGLWDLLFGKQHTTMIRKPFRRYRARANSPGSIQSDSCVSKRLAQSSSEIGLKTSLRE